MDIKEWRARPAFEGLNDEEIVRTVHETYYPDLDPAAVAESMGVKIRPAVVPAEPAPDRGVMGWAKDIGIAGMKSAIALPEAAVGIADLVSGGRAGKALEEIGYRPGEAKKALDEYSTPATKAANKEVQEAEGLWGTIKAVAKNPSVVPLSVVESLAPMLGGGVAARGIMAGATALSPALQAAKAAPFVASAGARSALSGTQVAATGLGEGVMMAGSAAEQIRQQTADGLLTGEQAGLGLATGAGGALFGMLGARIAQKLGLADVDSMLAGAATNPRAAKGITRMTIEGAVAEGLLEELPQSVMEQVLQNIALDRPLDEGVNQAAVLGTLAGAAMGGGMNLYRAATDKPNASPPPPGTPGTPPPGTPGTPPAPAPTPQDIMDAPTVDSAIQKALQAVTGRQERMREGVATADDLFPVGTPKAVAEPAVSLQPEPGFAGEEIPVEAASERDAAIYDEATQGDALATDPNLRSRPGGMLTGGAPAVGPADVVSNAGAVQPVAGSATGLPAAGTPVQNDAGAVPGGQQQPGRAGDDAGVEPGWKRFPPESKSLGVPRADMPQIKAEHRGAMTQFLLGRGITHEQEQEADPAKFRPTQAEYSDEKVQAARDYAGGTDRAILVSADNRVLDGHHQWLKAMADRETVRVIRLHAPITQLLKTVKEFPSATTDDASDASKTGAGDQIATADSGAAPSGEAVRDDAPAIRAGGEGAVQPADAQPADVTPGGDAGNGFRRGATAGERYRVAEVASAGGAIALEKRLPAGTAATFYVGKDGGLIDSDDVNFIGSGKERLWIPPTEAAAAEAKRILEAMGQLALGDPRRAELKAELKALVTGAQVAADDAKSAPEKEKSAAAQPENRETVAPVAGTAAPLYAQRKVANAAAIIDWAKSQGFKDIEEPGKLHVTIAFSRDPIDPGKVGNSSPAYQKGKITGTAGRKVERLGDEGAIVLKFDSPVLQARWAQFRKAGASWDFESYQPHITISYGDKGMDLTKVQPYTGPIELAPESMEALDLTPKETTDESAKPAAEVAPAVAASEAAADDGGMANQPDRGLQPAASGDEGSRTGADGARDADSQAATGVDQPRDPESGQFVAEDAADESAAPAAAEQIAGGEAWWKSMTPWARKDALKAVGATAFKETVLWRYFPEQLQQKLTAIIGTSQDPLVTEKKGAVESKKAREVREAGEARAAYFTPGNVVRGYAGFDEVLAYNAPKEPGGAWSVTVHEVREDDGGRMVRQGKPQDARTHSTQPTSQEMKAGPAMKLDPAAPADVPYSAPRADGKPFDYAPPRGVQQAAPAQQQEAAPPVAPGAVKVPPTVDAALTADMQKQQTRVKRLRTAAEDGGLDLEGKKAAQLKVTAAEATLRRMRMTRFDAEDAAVAAVAAGSMQPFEPHADLFPGAAEALRVLVPAPPPVAEPSPPRSDNATAARALLAEYTEAMKNGAGEKGIAVIRRRAEKLAAQTPATDEAAVLALDMLATRMGIERKGVPTGFTFADAPTPKPRRTQPGEPGYTLLDARNDLIEMRSQYASQGRVADARLGDRVRQQEKLVKEMEAAETKPAPSAADAALTEKEKAAKAKMLEAAGKLAQLLSKNTRTNITPEQEQAMLPIVIELFSGAFDLGYVKFKQAARYVRKYIANIIDQDAADSIPIDTLQGAYIATARRYQDLDITPKKDVIAVESIAELEEGDEVETDAPAADTGNTAKETEDDRATDDATGEDALGPVAPREDGGTGGGGSLFGGDASGGQAGGGKGAGTDGGRLPGARGGRGGAGRTRTPRTGAGRRPGAVGEGGTGRTGEGVSGQDDLLNPERTSAPNIGARNYRITDADRLGQGGEVQKFNDNIAAIRVLHALDAEQRRATPDEQRALARYVGWGGLKNAFPDPIKKVFKAGWEERGAELRGLMSDADYKAASRSTLDAHYTSETVVRAMWSAVQRLGFKGGLVLESSMGTGNFLGMIPEALAGGSRFVGVEYDATTARIAEALYPQETVLHAGFHKVPVPDNTFMLNIGNPPFGPQSINFQYKPELNGVSIHNQFFRAAMDALRPGGVQSLVVSRYLMDTQDKASRLALAKQAKLLGAIRLPDTAFKENARTEVVTDIIFLQKLTEAEQKEMAEAVAAYSRQPAKGQEEVERRRLADKVPDWVETTMMADPLGGENITVNQYFKDNPKQILGVLERSGSMQHGQDVTVRLDDKSAMAGMLKDAIERLPEGVMDFPDDVMANTVARHKTLSDSLRIQLAKEEPGHLKFDLDGKLQRVLERETHEGDYEFMRQEITADSPWSEQLYLDANGRWYRLEVALDDKGAPKKVVKDGKVTKRNEYTRLTYQNDADVPSTLRLGEERLTKLTKLVKLRDHIKRQLTIEAEDKPEAMLEASRKKLREAYEAFVKDHGPVNRPANAAVVSSMPDSGLVLASEIVYKAAVTKEQAAKSGLDVRAEEVTPAPIMERRVVPKYEPPTKAASAADALIISLSERGRVDLERIAGLLGKTVDEVAAELQDGDKPLIFKDPETETWETANAYLSGPVRKKLVAAKAAEMSANVRALEAVQPEPWTSDQVTVMTGASWVPPAVYAQFYEHITEGKATASYSRATNTYSLNVKEKGPKHESWSVQGAQAEYILSRLLNSQPVVVMTPRTRDEGPKVDQEATAIAQLKAREMTDEFSDWVFRDGERRAELTALFNDKFNNRVVRQHDGQHLTLPGKVPDEIISMRRHQKNAIWRGIAERFNLYDHAVGAGKTYTGIARAIERRRMGLSKKPMIVVPNHLVEQWEADVYKLYPGAKVLAAGQKDFESKRRRRLFAKIATGDWDIVIVPHSSFGFIGIAPETEERFLQQELQQAIEAVKEAEEQAREDGTDTGRGKPFGVKEAERLVEKIQSRMDKLAAKKDRLLTFEQMGVDDLTVDEAHEFKNLFYSSRLTGVRGMGNKTGSQKAFDLYNKVRVLRESPTGSVTFLTGTPISNSAVEMYTMLRYLAADELKDMGLEHFDAWRSQFVEATPAFEPTESGRLKEVTRLGRSWNNMRSLMDLYYGVTDAVTNEDIQKAYREDKGEEFPLPKVKGGERQLAAIKPTEAQLSLLEQVMEAFDNLPNEPDIYERNKMRLRLMNVARAVSLDVRSISKSKLADAGLPTTAHSLSEKGGKLDRASAEIKRIYDKWTPDLGTQLVFLDRSVPKSKGDDKIIKAYDALQAKAAEALEKNDEAAYRVVQEALEKFDPNEIAELRTAQDGGWNAYQQLKDNLVAAGIPANEIRFIQEATDDAQKKAMFDAVNGGKVRVLIGSTPRMGAGTNVQQRLVGLHHVDVTWKPSDIEQREGRIIRQPSPDSFSLMQKYGFGHEVEILAYATERTVDAKMWSLNATKLKMINGIRKYDGAFTMEFEDEDSVSMAEMAALASGDPLLLERVTLESQLATLELQERGHRRNQWTVEDQLKSAERAIKDAPGEIAAAKQQAALARPALEAIAESANTRKVTIEGKEYNTQFAANAAMASAIKDQQAGDEKARYSINVNGKPLTSKDAIAEAIAENLGDVEPFMLDVGGKTYIRRTQAAKAIAEAVNAARKERGKQAQANITLGKLGDLELVAGIRFGSKEDDIALALHKDGKTVATGYGTGEDPHLQFTPAKLRGHVEKLLESLEQASRQTGDWAKERAARAERDLPGLRESAGKPFPKAAEIEEKRARLAEVVQTLAGSTAASRAAATQDETDPDDDGPGGGLLNQDGGPMDMDSGGSATPADLAVYMLAMNKATDARAILEHMADASPVPFFRELAERLLALGVKSAISTDLNARKGQKAPNGRAPAAMYDAETDTAYLWTPRNAERHVMHESTHAATARAIRAKTPAALRMQGLYDHVKRQGGAATQYGMTNLDEFVAEAFTNGDFQDALREMDGPPSGKFKSAWDWFVNVVRQILGLPQNVPPTALDEVLRVGADLMQENARLQGRGGDALAASQGPAFYSALAKGIEKQPAKSLPAAGWLGAINAMVNKGEAKADEVEWSGIREWLDMQQGKVTKEQVQDFLAANGVRVEEVVKGQAPEAGPRELDAIVVGATALGYDLSQDDLEIGRVVFVARGNGDPVIYSARNNRLTNEATGEQEDNPALMALARRADVLGGDMMDGPGDEDGTRYSSYTLPGGTNYREVLLTLPVTRVSFESYRASRPAITEEAAREGYARYLKDPSISGVTAEVGYRSSHWDEPNIIAHIRLNERTDADGKRVLFVEELQSDWGADMRRARTAIAKAVDDDFQGIIERMKAAGDLEVDCD